MIFIPSSEFLEGLLLVGRRVLSHEHLGLSNSSSGSDRRSCNGPGSNTPAGSQIACETSSKGHLISIEYTTCGGNKRENAMQNYWSPAPPKRKIYRTIFAYVSRSTPHHANYIFSCLQLPLSRSASESSSMGLVTLLLR
jgi:hypothetical protein